jgi:hypothetical protein
MQFCDKSTFEHFLVAIEGPIGMVGRKRVGVIASLTKLLVPDAPFQSQWGGTGRDVSQPTRIVHRDDPATPASSLLYSVCFDQSLEHTDSACNGVLGIMFRHVETAK